MNSVKNHPAWIEFAIWALANGISLEHPDDFSPWWDCFAVGYEVGKEIERADWQARG